MISTELLPGVKGKKKNVQDNLDASPVLGDKEVKDAEMQMEGMQRRPHPIGILKEIARHHTQIWTMGG